MPGRKTIVIAALGGRTAIGAALAAVGITADELLDEMEDVFTVDANDTRACRRR